MFRAPLMCFDTGQQEKTQKTRVNENQKYK